MASTFNVAEILADIAVQTNSPTFAANTRVTLTQVTYWLAQSVRSISALLRQHHYEDREFVQTSDLNTVSGLNLLSLPANCGEVQAVIWARGVNDYVLVEHAKQDDITERDPAGWTSCTPRWRLEGQTIAFYPAPQAVHAVQVYYTVHIPTPLGATFQARVDTDRWVTLDVAIKVATAKRQSPAAFEQQKALLENDYLAKARQRDEESSDTIRDVRGMAALARYRQRWRSG